MLQEMAAMLTVNIRDNCHVQFRVELFFHSLSQCEVKSSAQLSITYSIYVL